MSEEVDWTMALAVVLNDRTTPPSKKGEILEKALEQVRAKTLRYALDRACDCLWREVEAGRACSKCMAVFQGEGEE